ncbi:sortase [Patescibacteria group bacterium]|nr:sortase [Patescibacteria group bacterium]
MSTIALPLQSAILELTEADIRLFLREAPQPIRQLKSLYLTAVGIVLAGGVIYLGMNYNAFFQLATTSSANTVQTVTTPPPTAQPAVATPVPTPDIPNDTVNLPGLDNLSAPIHWDVPITGNVQQALETGVINIAGTAKPGLHGMVIITGHSSNYIWDKGQYNSVFAPLAKVQLGQEIKVAYNNREYTYTITKIYQVQPTDLSVLTGTGDGIRLITCTPIGTSLRRLVVEGTQTTPDPAGNTPFTPDSFTGNLPADR